VRHEDHLGACQRLNRGRLREVGVVADLHAYNGPFNASATSACSKRCRCHAVAVDRKGDAKTLHRRIICQWRAARTSTPNCAFGRVKVCRETSRVSFLIWKELIPAAATLRGIKMDRGHPARPGLLRSRRRLHRGFARPGRGRRSRAREQGGPSGPPYFRVLAVACARGCLLRAWDDSLRRCLVDRGGQLARHLVCELVRLNAGVQGELVDLVVPERLLDLGGADRLVLVGARALAAVLNELLGAPASPVFITVSGDRGWRPGQSRRSVSGARCGWIRACPRAEHNPPRAPSPTFERAR
jgi:hypothetical protein